MNKILTSLVDKITLQKYGFKLTDKKIWYIDGIVYERHFNNKKDLLVVNLYKENQPHNYDTLTITPFIRFSEVEDTLLEIIENQRDHLVTLDTQNVIIIDGFNLNEVDFKPDDLNKIILELGQQLKDKTFPYFEEYQTLQDVNDKLFPLQSTSEMTNLPRYSNAFLRDYTTEKAMITLKICQNPNFDKYLNWYRKIVEKKIIQPKETWKKDYRVFQELDRTFLSK